MHYLHCYRQDHDPSWGEGQHRSSWEEEPFGEESNLEVAEFKARFEVGFGLALGRYWEVYLF